MNYDVMSQNLMSQNLLSRTEFEHQIRVIERFLETYTAAAIVCAAVALVVLVAICLQEVRQTSPRRAGRAPRLAPQKPRPADLFGVSADPVSPEYSLSSLWPE